MAEVTSRIWRMRDPRTPAPTFMAVLWPSLAAVRLCSSCSIGCMSLQHLRMVSVHAPKWAEGRLATRAHFGPWQ